MGGKLPVTVVIPVYRGLSQTKACLDSVLQSKIGESDVLLVNDASPEKEITAYCETLSKRETVSVIKNNKNLGFVGTVNKAMEATGKRDLVLLNSDTRVSGDWLSRLQTAAYRKANIGTVTPFSNNAEICSYPQICCVNSLLEGMNEGELHGVASKVNDGLYLPIPTAVGFCMYIRRALIDQVGQFDSTAFGKGYGEENDFCLRAEAAGWQNILAADCFVYHEGGVSFSEQKQALVANAETVIANRYPSYFDDVKKFIQQDPIRPFRDRIDAEIFRRSDEAALALWALRAQEYLSRCN
ncbi:glycosyltransferase family 2 protein [Gilvimarinus chinensis]|uniref:glycosyltransferase family 2 protein n=1 Tax=Gilvimarinus chinensis TaxID=396005 RepID=UPI000372146D|nr:glycosyltransferase [Gilvimarinus chinensis]